MQTGAKKPLLSRRLMSSDSRFPDDHLSTLVQDGKTGTQNFEEEVDRHLRPSRWRQLALPTVVIEDHDAAGFQEPPAGNTVHEDIHRLVTAIDVNGLI